MSRGILSSIVFIFLSSIALAASPVQERADRFLKLANAGFQALFRVNQEAQWNAVTDVTPEHDAAAEASGKAFAAFNGNPAIITEAPTTHRSRLRGKQSHCLQHRGVDGWVFIRLGKKRRKEKG